MNERDLYCESWVCDECGDTILKCSDYTSKQIREYLNEHPEYTIKLLPLFL